MAGLGDMDMLSFLLFSQSGGSMNALLPFLSMGGLQTRSEASSVIEINTPDAITAQREREKKIAEAAMEATPVSIPRKPQAAHATNYSHDDVDQSVRTKREAEAQRAAIKEFDREYGKMSMNGNAAIAHPLGFLPVEGLKALDPVMEAYGSAKRQIDGIMLGPNGEVMQVQKPKNSFFGLFDLPW